MAFVKPSEVIRELHISSSAAVADFGSGSGHFTLALARALSEGHVYAVDIQKGLLTRTLHEAKGEGLENVDIVWDDLETPGGSSLKDASLSMVLISNVLFQIEKRAALFEEARRVLKPGGRLVVIEWSNSFKGMGPEPNDVVSEVHVKELAQSVGFDLERELEHPGDHHYGLVFKKI